MYAIGIMFGTLIDVIIIDKLEKANANLGK